MAAASILTFETFEDLWQGALEEWLLRHADNAWMRSEPTVLLCPNSVYQGFITAEIARRLDRPLAGVSLWTPGKLRRYLLEKCIPDLKIATAEDLTLILRSLAENWPDTEFAETIERESRPLLRAWDLFCSGRVDQELWGSLWGGFIRKLEDSLTSAGRAPTGLIDWLLHDCPPLSRPLLNSLFASGFSISQGSVFPLLTAAIRMSAEASLAIPIPGTRSQEMLWLGTFEERFGASRPLVSSDPTSYPHRGWTAKAEFGERSQTASDGVEACIFSGRPDEAASIVDWVRGQLGTDENYRIGVVLPQDPVLIREVVQGLVEAGVPVHDAIGHFPSAPPRQQLFAAWIEYQRTGSIASAAEMLRIQHALSHLDGAVVAEIERDWDGARQATLSDRVSVLRAYLSRDDSETHRGGEWLAKWSILPESASLELYFQLADPLLVTFGFGLEWQKLRNAWDPVHSDSLGNLRRAAFLEWLFDSLKVPGRHRSPEARNTLSPVQVVSYREFAGQRWTHLCFGGLNERLVPTVERESPFLPPEMTHRHFMRHSTTGSQGEGHRTLREGRGFPLDVMEQRSLGWLDLLDAASKVSGGILLTATLDSTGRDRNATMLSEYWDRLIQAAGIQPVVHSLDRPISGLALSFPRLPSVESTAAAVAARWNSETPFDEFSFCLAGQSPGFIRLTARQWETWLERPAEVWLEALARLRPPVDFSSALGLSLVHGFQVHRCLQLGERGRFVVFDRTFDWRNRIQATAQGWRKEVEHAFEIAGESLPDFWTGFWGRVLGDALQFSQLLCEGLSEGMSLATEVPLPRGSRISLARGTSLEVMGRIDLLIRSASDTWVVDFKTGSDQPLTEKRLSKGTGLQVLLYGLAIASADQPVHLCVLNNESAFVPQIDVTAGDDPSGLLEPMAAAVRAGRFGPSRTFRSEYGYAGRYPISSVQIPDETWVVKRALTFPEFISEV